MWPHKDLAWWAFVLALFALIVAYPLEVLAHITAPRWKDWWFARSRISLQNRIAKLGDQLAELKTRDTITNTQAFAFGKMEYIEDQMYSSVHLLLTLIFFGVVLTANNYQSFWGKFFLGWALFALLFNFARSIWKVKMYSAEFTWQTREQALSDEIQKLTARLK